MAVSRAVLVASLMAGTTRFGGVKGVWTCAASTSSLVAA